MTYQDAVLSHAPLAYLPLTETGGTEGTDVFADASGNGHLGEMQPLVAPGGAASFLTGEVAAQLSGGGGQIVPEIAGGYPALSAWTVEFWLQLGGPVGDPQTWFDWGARNPGFTARLDVTLQQTDSTAFSFAVDVAGTAITLDCPMSDALCWHHYAVSYDGSALRLYRDGAQVALNSDDSVAGWTFEPDFTEFESDSYPQVVNVAHVALYGAALSGAQVAANYAAATPRQDAACFRQTVRLRHAGGAVDWEHDATTFRVRSDDAVVLQTPLAVLTRTPDTLVGKDVLSGLPAFCPAPIIRTSPPIPPAPAPVPDTAPLVRCGSAVAMATELERAYSNVVGFGRAVASVGAPWLIAAIIDFLAEVFTTGEATPLLLQDTPGLVQLANFLLNQFLTNEWPALTTDANDAILASIYCALSVVDNQIIVTDSTLAGWRANLSAASASFLGLQEPLLELIMQVPWVENWQAVAYVGSSTPSSVCSAITCP